MLEPKLIDTIAGSLGIDPNGVTGETSPDNTTEWDSVGHLNLILDIEESYGIRIPAMEIPELNSVARIQDAIVRLSKR